MLRLKANKKLVQKTIQERTGQKVTLKDLSNIRTCDKKHRGIPGSELERAVSLLRADPDSIVNIVNDRSTGVLQGIFFQDPFMRGVFEKFPEILLVDATYKLNDLRMPLYVLVVIDGNGESEIVGWFLVAAETEDNLRQMIDLFKVHNPAHERVRTIMTDKDMVERNVLSSEFPNAELVLCLFHVLQALRREVTMDKMGIRSEQRKQCLKALESIIASPSPEEYERRVEVLRNLKCDRVFSYYMDNWDPIKDEFVAYFQSQRFTLTTRTNNRVEAINGQLKSVCTKFVTVYRG